MAKTILGCPIPTEDIAEGLNLDPKDVPEIARRLDSLAEIMSATRSRIKAERAYQAAINQNVIIQNMEMVGNLVSTTALSPQRARGLQAWLARNAAITQKWGGLGNQYTEAGWVRESLNRIQRLYRGEFNQQLRLAGVADTAADATQQIRKLGRRYNLKNSDIEYIAVMSHDLAWFPTIAQATYVNKVGQEILQRKTEAFAEELATRFGMSNKDIDTVMRQGNRIVNAYISVGNAAENLGMKAANKDFLKHIPRVLSREAEMRFDWKYRDLRKGSISYNNSVDSDVAKAAMMSRLSSDFVVEDEVVLDYIIRSIGQRDEGDPLALYKRAGASSIGDIVTDQKTLTDTFMDILHRSPATIEALVDNGIIGKLPITSPELLKRLNNVFEMPFKGLSEVFAVDYRTGMEVYRRQLEGIAAKSGYFNLIVKNAVDGNWGVTTSERLANLKDYHDFVPLVNRSNSPGVFGEGTLSKFGINPKDMANPSLLENLWVHPTVGDIIKATLEVQTDPHSLGIIARVFKELFTRFRSLALTSLEYIPRQVWNGAIMLGAGGGDLLLMPQYLTKILMSTLSGQDMSKFLDNKRAIYRAKDGTMLTELGVWQRAQYIGFLNESEPLTGDTLRATTYHPWKSPAAAVRSYAATYRMGAGRLAEQFAYDVGHAIDQATYPIRWSNNWVDQAARFAGLISSLRKYEPATPAHFLNSARQSFTRGSFVTYGSVEDAVEHWKNYFYIYDDFSKADKVIGNYIIPFWHFHSKNIPAVLRHIVNHPTRFIAYQRLYAVANTPVANDDRLTEGTVQPWLWQTAPIFFRVDGGREDGRDAFFAIPMTSLDPYQSVVEMGRSAGDHVLNMFGVRTKKPTSDRLSDGSSTNKLIGAMLENTYPLYRAAIQAASNTGEFGQALDNPAKINTFLGYEMPRSLQVILEATLPILSTVNRYNPGNVFGTAAELDPYSGKWSLGEPSRMPGSGGVPRTDKDSFKRDNPYAWLAYTGVKVYPVDIALNSGMTHDAISIAINEKKKFVQQARRDLARVPPGEVYNERQQQIADALYIIEQMQYDLRNLRAWAKAHGYNVEKAYSVLQESNIRVGDLDELIGPTHIEQTTQPQPPVQQLPPSSETETE